MLPDSSSHHEAEVAVKKSWKLLWNEWATDTTMHGIRFIVMPTIWRMRKYVGLYFCTTSNPADRSCVIGRPTSPSSAKKAQCLAKLTVLKPKSSNLIKVITFQSTLNLPSLVWIWVVLAPPRADIDLHILWLLWFLVFFTGSHPVEAREPIFTHTSSKD